MVKELPCCTCPPPELFISEVVKLTAVGVLLVVVKLTTEGVSWLWSGEGIVAAADVLLVIGISTDSGVGVVVVVVVIDELQQLQQHIL